MSTFLRIIRGLLLSGLISTGELPAQDAAADLRRSLEQARRRADDVIARYLHVQGLDRPGKEVFPRDSTYELRLGGSATATKLRFLQTEKRFYRMEVEPAGGASWIEGSNGPGSFWMVGEAFGMIRPRDPSDLAVLMLDFRRDAEFIRKNFQARRQIPDAVVAGKKFTVVGMQQHRGAWEFWCFDPETGVLERVEVSLDGKHPEAAMVFSDFKTIDDVLEPTRIVTGDGAKKGDIRIQSMANRVKVTESLTKGDFVMPEAEDKAWAKTEEAIAKYVKASGGVSNLGKIVSRVTKLKCELTTSGLAYEMTLSQKLPDWVLVENNVAGVGKSWQGYNGRTGWASSEVAGYRTMRGEELQLFIRSSDLHNATDFSKIFNVRRLMGTKPLNGRTTTAILLGNKHSLASTHYFDTETGQLVQVEAVLGIEGGGTLPVTIEFSDYRSIDGVVLPFTTVVTNPAMRLVTKVETIQHNLELSDALFEPRKDP